MLQQFGCIAFIALLHSLELRLATSQIRASLQATVAASATQMTMILHLIGMFACAMHHLTRTNHIAFEGYSLAEWSRDLLSATAYPGNPE